MNLTPKQRAFADFYIELCNATESARRAGYSAKTAKSIGAENLTKPDIKIYIARRQEKIESERTASLKEIQELRTAIMRGQEKDQFGIETSIADRLRAAGDLEKSLRIKEEEETKAAAKADADAIINSAKQQAEDILASARTKAYELEQKISGLESRYELMKTRIKLLLYAEIELLDKGEVLAEKEAKAQETK